MITSVRAIALAVAGGSYSGVPERFERRMRVFAGPNGSGKSTIIESVRKEVVGGFPVDLGEYINADDIGREPTEERSNQRSVVFREVSHARSLCHRDQRGLASHRVRSGRRPAARPHVRMPRVSLFGLRG